jgi:RNase_H superfamily
MGEGDPAAGGFYYKFVTKDIVYFDLETQRTAGDVGGWNRKQLMKVSLAVIFSTKDGNYTIYPEKQVGELVTRLQRADMVVGYNILHFDYEVLMGYTVLDLPHYLPTLDLMVDVERAVGHRLALNALAQATLGIGKIADGLDAIRWWREGKLLQIAEYCCFDVKVTRLVHEYALQHGELFYTDRSFRKRKISVNWRCS